MKTIFSVIVLALCISISDAAFASSSAAKIQNGASIESSVNSSAVMGSNKNKKAHHKSHKNHKSASGSKKTK